MKKRSERRKHCAPAAVPRIDAQVRDGCSKVEPKIPPTADPLPGGRGPPKFNQLEMVSHYLHLQTQFGEDRCTQFRVIVVTDTARPPATNTNTQTGRITIHCAAS